MLYSIANRLEAQEEVNANDIESLIEKTVKEATSSMKSLLSSIKKANIIIDELGKKSNSPEQYLHSFSPLHANLINLMKALKPNSGSNVAKIVDRLMSQPQDATID